MTVTLTTDNPDLSGVATDGSAVFFLNDTTAGNRNFAKITAADNTLKTVTVAEAFGFTLTKAWAIGGVRATIAGTLSKKLLENNSSSGDAMPGWAVEMQSAHAETIAAAVTLRRSGDQTTGLITLRGKSGAATKPALTFSNNGIAIGTTASYINMFDFDMLNSNATKTASVAINRTGAGFTGWHIRNIKIATSGSKFWKGVVFAGGSPLIHDCEIGYCASVGMEVTAGAAGDRYAIKNNYIHHCTSHGISTLAGAIAPAAVAGNIIAFNGGSGISHITTVPMRIMNNTIHGNTADGITSTVISTNTGTNGFEIGNNILTFNGGWGINFTGAGISDAVLNGLQWQIFNNCHNGNTSGWISSSIAIDTRTIAADPSGGLASITKDYAGTTNGTAFAVDTSVKAKGDPLAGTTYIGTGSTTYSYDDIGAAQRQEAGTTARGKIIGSG